MQSKLLEHLLDFVFPALCQNCGQEGSYLCPACQSRIPAGPALCLICTHPSLAGKIHQDCRNRNFYLEGLLVAASYQESSVRNLIWHLKYSGVRRTSEVLAQLMADYLVAQNLLDYFSHHCLVPIPLHRRRRLERGFNQTELLAQNLASRLGLEYLPVLEKPTATARQVDLPKEQRLKNLEGRISFATANLAGKKIILIDDVATTGATLNECAKVLKQAGAAEIWGFVVARN